MFSITPSLIFLIPSSPTEEALGKLLWFGAKKLFGMFSCKNSLCLATPSPTKIIGKVCSFKIVTNSFMFKHCSLIKGVKLLFSFL